ncbi:ras-specific guanine nucleotide-releasing factor 2-like isoform X1 [Portunus trituberculatus]|uniref:ras-specific guanine nucleotide-releasing factor 2-like isoform X1 n=1 Tax=Portunus trituberculatus TaxID=210409 RepID=UPI001E1CE5C4|nr:ras-specific guanine nucleotide-releasing factor 2-like isoform X1 [Portunus trituberculatus]
MLSPKMQRTIRINENQVLMLAEKARHDHNYSGYLYKRSSDSNKWQLRWFTLYQNLLFYSEGEASVKPSGVIMLEGCYCERLITTNTNTKNKDTDKQFCFAITYRRENQRQYDLRAETEGECKAWIDMIRMASFNKLLLQKEELEQKHLHLLQIVESEKTAKWQYTQQCEELTSEIKKLRAELCTLKKEWRVVPPRKLEDLPEDSEEIKKIKKVQSFFRGWLCRRRWKQIVEEYIRSPHAESMRKRNSLVFRMVEAEEEYVEQLNLLVSCFLRPFKMAASSKKPPSTHEDVNSIFLNSETLLFLHQIFLKGLSARMESWPTLVLDGGRETSSAGSSPRQKRTCSTIQLLGNTHLGDLFDMLLPMLSIYQEYVRNHHYSLQVLAECKQNPHFSAFLNRLENKPNLQGRTLETFLTYPMHQIPRYIITLHELLAHTPHNHVERKSLDNARMQLEDLSRQMHDEVSETENIRKNLAIERMIVEGCDILLDVNQMFVRQGSLIQVLGDRPRSAKSRLSQFKSEKEAVRQCFLFSNHLIVATRTSGGKLHLVQSVGKIPLNDATLIEDPNELGNQDDDGESSVSSFSSQSSGVSDSSAATSSSSGHAKFQVEQANLDFKIVVEQKCGTPITLHLVAPTMQEKQAWISDISQCLDNVHFNNLFRSSMSDTSSITMPHFIKNDPKLFRDDVDIRFSRTLNSCKVPHIRYATPERLLERLTDLRFLSIDFLNTFLLTYRVFTDGISVLEALKKVYYSPDVHDQMADSRDSSVERSPEYVSSPPPDLDSGRNSPRRVSNFSAFSGFEVDPPRERCWTFDAQVAKASGNQHWRWSYRRFEEEQRELEERRAREEASESGGQNTDNNLPVSAPNSPFSPKKVTIRTEDDAKFLTIPKGRRNVGSTSSADTLIGEETSLSQPDSPTDASTSTLVGGSGLMGFSEWRLPGEGERPSRSRRSSRILDAITSPPRPCSVPRRSIPRRMSSLEERPQMEAVTSGSEAEDEQEPISLGPRRPSSNRSYSSALTASSGFLGVGPRSKGKRMSGESDAALTLGGLASPRSSVHTATPRSSFQVPDSPSHSVPRVGVVITSSRQSQRRSSSASAAAAFAVATAGSSNPRDIQKTPPLGRFSVGGEGRRSSFRERPRQESIISTAATMRVLNVLRHWVSKHSQDFDNDHRLRNMTIAFLEDLVCCPTLLPAEHKAASQLLRLLTKEEPPNPQEELANLLAPPSTPSKENIETLSALEVAEQMTYIDHQIFVAIRSEEFLKTAWMKEDKQQRAPYILLITRRFNEMSRLVASEVIRGGTLATRVAVIEKWVAVADICRCLHNYNGVLQVCAAFQNSSVFRLKKTWEKVSKTTRQTLEKLQVLVSSDGRFRSLRDALHRCDPPCIPYLGMYLTDLSFIEEGTPNFTEDGLLNFSKMRMIAHVIREIRHFQQTPYKIEYNARVASYLLDPSLLLSDDNLYRLSLDLEPRRSTLTHVTVPLLANVTSSASSSSSSS